MSNRAGRRPLPVDTADDAPWKGRFRAPVVRYTQVARCAPDRALAVTNPSGVHQLHAWSVSDGSLRQLTDRPEGQVTGVISPDGRWVYYLDDHRGDEIGHWVRVPWEGGPPEDVTPDMPGYTSWDVSISDAGDRLAFTAAVGGTSTLHVLDLGADGAPSGTRALHTTPSLVSLEGISGDGTLVILGSTERSGKPEYSLVCFDADTGEPVGELWDGPETSVSDVVFSRRPGDVRVVAASNRTGVRRPLVWDPRSGDRHDLAVGDLAGEIIPWDWSKDGAQVLLCQVDRAVQTLHLASLDGASPRRLDAPPGSYGRNARGAYFGPGTDIFAVWQDSVTPLQGVALDGATGRLARVDLPAGEVAPGRKWRSITYQSTGGDRIQAWLATPEGEGPWPAVLETHGGPESVTLETFSPMSQAWLDHGFCFLSINYRGSTTFGKEFQEKIWGRLGECEVEDMAAGREWLIHEGIARPDEVFLTGWSYGGYLTLHALGTCPELWAAGMAGVAVADWVSEYDDENEVLRAYDRVLFGGSPEEQMERYVRSSPITYAEHVAAPVLIIQGRNDSRCPHRQVELYEARMRELGKPIEVVWFEAGHAGPSANPELGVRFQQRMLEFAHEALSRRQER